MNECIEDVRNAIVKVNRDFLELTPQEWVMRIMKSLRKCALNVSNYKEFREGLVETGVLVLIVMEYSDILFRDYLSKPAVIQISCEACGELNKHRKFCPNDPLNRPLP